MFIGYPKIETIYERDMEGTRKLIDGKFRDASDEGTTTAWMNMPESPNDDYTGDLRRRIEKCEERIELLMDAIDSIVQKLPKE